MEESYIISQITPTQTHSTMNLKRSRKEDSREDKRMVTAEVCQLLTDNVLPDTIVKMSQRVSGAYIKLMASLHSHKESTTDPTSKTRLS